MVSNLRQIRWFLVLPAVCLVPLAQGQIDPVKRELVQFGYNQPLEGSAPICGYAFYYYNQPSFLRTNMTLRLAVAPVYMDSEVGFQGALGPNTDIGLGLSGGGFADTYSEIRLGKWIREESFTGHGGGLSASIYHLFNPGQQIPLNGVLRASAAEAVYQRDSQTAPNFVIPDDRTTFGIRTGLRWGGQEPVLLPDLAMEMSAWYEGQFRLNPENYGFSGDRRIEAVSHLLWGRALLAYTLPESGHQFQVSLTAGVSADADRFSAYRIGGVLPLASEFPLTVPGYFYQELSATRFVLLNVSYSLPLDARKRWELTVQATTAGLNYLPGVEQPNNWNSGVGGGITYRSSSGAWQVFAGYSYGVNAIRDTGEGSHSIGFLVQLDLEHARSAFYDPGSATGQSRGLDRFLHIFQ